MCVPNQPAQSSHAPQQVPSPPGDRKRKAGRRRQAKSGECADSSTFIRADPRRHPSGRRFHGPRTDLNGKDREYLERLSQSPQHDGYFGRHQHLADAVKPKHLLNSVGVFEPKQSNSRFDLLSLSEPTGRSPANNPGHGCEESILACD
jgi:hypothetical protein